MSKEAMKLALEALEAGEYYIDDLEAIVYAADDLGTHEDRAKMQSAITALREALAEQPAQQEPFAFYFETYSYEGQKSTWFVACPCDGKLNGKPGIPLYTSPPAPVQQEPVSWGVDWGRAGDIPCVSIIKRLPGGGIEVVAVEYGPQRTWVGLQDDEIYSVLENLQVMHHRPPTTDSRVIFARAIEAKLKEKNT